MDYLPLLTERSSCFLAPSTEGQVAESTTRYHFIRERHLQAMWLEQKYFKNLTTTHGVRIEVLSPGIWNGEAGPDFLKAHVRIGNKELRGDVEIHLNDDSWYHHQHHSDERYNNVVLHVGYWAPRSVQDLLNAKGEAIPCAHLEKHLTIPESRILKLIDLDLYPYKYFVGSGACAQALFRKLPEAKAMDFFRNAAYWRLKQKKEYLCTRIETPALRLAGGIAMALGYKHNADAFLDIFLRLTGYPGADEREIFARALGWCNFFSEKHRSQWSASSEYSALASLFDRLDESRKNEAVAFKIARTRPSNHPVRRLAVLAKLACDPRTATLEDEIASAWQAQWRSGKRQGWKDLKKYLFELLSLYRDPFWEYHLTFTGNPQTKAVALIGDDLKRAILVNACLPLLYEGIESRGDPVEEMFFHAFYACLKAPASKKSDYLAHRFFGDSTKGKILRSADIQQGAYQLHRDFCLHYEASCAGCPFVERFEAQMMTLQKNAF